MEGKIFSELEEPELKAALSKNGLRAVRVSREDAVLSKHSAVGPNISDVTLEAYYPAECCAYIGPIIGSVREEKVEMPMIRGPNFAHEFADIWIEKFRVFPTGAKKPVSLLELLSDPVMIDAALNVKGKLVDAQKDNCVLVHTQACVLRPRAGAEVQFAPRIFNYQSHEDTSVMLVLVISWMGVSAFLPDHRTTRMMHNDDGKERWMKATAPSAFRANTTLENLTAQEQLEDHLLIVQVPLKVQRKRKEWTLFGRASLSTEPMMLGAASRVLSSFSAVNMSVGNFTGKMHTGLKNAKHQTIERDFCFPIRVVVQHYYVAQRPPTAAEIDQLAARMWVYNRFAAARGSLVVDGPTPRTTDVANRDWGTCALIDLQ